MLILNREQVRDVDRRAIEDYGMSGLVLMENAGRGCVEVLRSLDVQGPVVIVCGKGNNGGDGFVIARHLDNAGIAVRVLLLVDAAELTGDAAANFQILSATDVEIFPFTHIDDPATFGRAVADAEWILDAMLGTGATGSPRAPYDVVIRRLNELPARRMAIDLPSGLDCDTGQASEPTFRAEQTCTFVAAKPGLLGDDAGAFVGTMHVIDIGVPRKIIAP